MKFDFIKFAQTHQIPTLSEGNKHCRDGWIQTHCPFCRLNKWLLGWDIRFNRFHCWSCGKRSIREVVNAWGLKLSRQFLDGSTPAPLPDNFKVRRKSFHLPPTGPLRHAHRLYLRQRELSSTYLTEDWGVQGVGAAYGQDKPYAWRLFIPITYDNELVTFQTRAIKSHPVPYLACPAEREKRPIKECLYGYDQVPEKRIVVVEGVVDVWRLGFGAVATFGLNFMPAQVKLMAEFEEVFIMFDDEPQAQKQARNLALMLNEIGPKNVEIIELETGGDPGDLPQQKADEIMEELGF